MAAEDALAGMLDDSMLPWREVTGYKSPAEKAAAAKQAEAAQQAKDQLELAKAVYGQNQNISSALGSDLFGYTPFTNTLQGSAQGSAPTNAFGQTIGENGAVTADNGLTDVYGNPIGAEERARRIALERVTSSPGYQQQMARLQDPNLDPGTKREIEARLYEMRRSVQPSAADLAAGADAQANLTENFHATKDLGPAGTFGSKGSTVEGGKIVDRDLSRNPFTTQTQVNAQRPVLQAPNRYTGQTQPGGAISGGATSQQVTGQPEGSLSGMYQRLNNADFEALKEFKNEIDAITDPTWQNIAGDLTTQVGTNNAQSKADQQKAQDKMWGYTDVKETEEERLMREVARRNMENQLKGDREALAQNLKERGVYGSGAELAGNLAAMQEAASRRSLEELGAQANAQTRALSALGSYADTAGQMRTADTEEAKAGDVINMFNKNIDLSNQQAKVKTEGDNANRQQSRSQAKMTGTTNAIDSIGNRVSDEANKKIAVAGVGTGVNSTGLSQLGSARQGFADTLKEGAAFDYANDPQAQGGLIGRIIGQ